MKRKEAFTAEMERELIVRAKAGDRDAMEILLDQFNRMLWKFAVRRAPAQHDIEDFVQIARVHFIDAIRRYDFSREARLTTVLHASVSLQLLKTRKDRHVIHVPPNCDQKFREDSDRVRTGVGQLSCKTRGDSGEFELGDAIVDYRGADSLDDREELEMLQRNIKRLPERLREVIELRLKGTPLRSVGEIMGISTQRAQQLDKAAIAKLAIFFKGGVLPKRPGRKRGKVAHPGTGNHDSGRAA